MWGLEDVREGGGYVCSTESKSRRGGSVGLVVFMYLIVFFAFDSGEKNDKLFEHQRFNIHTLSTQ